MRNKETAPTPDYYLLEPSFYVNCCEQPKRTIHIRGIAIGFEENGTRGETIQIYRQDYGRVWRIDRACRSSSGRALSAGATIGYHPYRTSRQR